MRYTAERSGPRVRLEQILIRGFGTLRDREFTFPKDRVAIVAEANESGKTALLQAVVAALFGLPRQRATRASVPPKTVYDPWDKGPYGVEAIVAAASGRFHLLHDFRSSRFQAIDLATGRDITADLPSEPSRQWLGIGGDDFRRYACVSGKEQAALSGSNEIVSRLEELLSGSDVAVDSARRAIEAALQKYPGRQGRTLQIGTAVTRAEDELRALRARSDELARLRLEKAAALEEMEELQPRIPYLKDALLQAQGGAGRARLAEVCSRLDSHDRTAREIEELESEARSVSHLAGFSEKDLQDAAACKSSIEAEEQRAGQLGAEAARLRAELQNAASDLEAAGNLSGIGDDGLASLVSLGALAREAERQSADSRSVCQQCEEGFLDAGIDQNRARALLAAFEDSPTDLIRPLSAWADQEASSGKQRAELEAERQDLNAQVSRRVLPVPVLWSACAAGAIAAAALGGSGRYLAALALAGAAVVFGCWAVAGSRGERSLRARLDAVGARLQDEAEREESLRGQATRSATALGFASLEQACQALRQWGDLRPAIVRWRGSRDSLEEWERRLSDLRGQALGLAPDYRSALDEESLLSAGIERLHAEASSAVAARKRHSELQTQAEACADALAEARAKLAELTAGFAVILDRGQVARDLALDDAMTGLLSRAEQARRLRLITEHLLPDARERLLDPDEEERLRGEKLRLEAQIPGDAGQAASSTEEANLELEARRSELATAESRLQELRLGLWETLERIRDELPDIEDGLVDLAEYIQRATRFRDASAIALEVLEHVGSHARQVWSGWLKDTVTSLLGALDLRWSQAVFADDLSFQLYDKERGAYLDTAQMEGHLSSGARDQVWLACRLGICQALSREEPLPLLLDDPFLTWDDERFARGMRLIAGEIASGNQVIVVTCHESRHALLREEDQQWFDSHFQIVDL